MEYLSPKDGRLPQHLSPRRLRAEIRVLIWFLAAATALVVYCAKARGAPVPMVRVMVERERAEVVVRGFDLLVKEPGAERPLAHEPRRAQVRIQCAREGELMVEVGPDSRTIKAAAVTWVSAFKKKV